MSNHFTKMSATNLQGSTFTHDLAPVTLFCGTNWSGKTTRLNAAALALCGYVPGLSEKQNDIYTLLATGNPLSVVIRSTEQGHTRQWFQERGSVRYQGPDGPAIPRVAADAMEYLSLSGPARVRFMFKSVKLPERFTARNLKDSIIANIKNIKLKPHTAAAEEAARSICCDIDQHTQVNASYMPVQEWLEVLVELVTEKKKAAVQNVQRMEKTGQGLTQVASHEQPAPPDAERRLHDARLALERARDEATTLNTQLERCRADYRETKAAADAGADVSALMVAVAALEAAPVKVPPEVDMTAAFKALEAAQKVNSELGGKAFQSAKEVERLTAALKDAKTAKACPTCGHKLAKKGAGAAALKVQLAEAEARHEADLKASSDHSVGSLAAAHVKFNQLDKLSKSRLAAFQQENARQVQLDQLRAKLSRVQAAATAAAKLPALEERGKELAPKHLAAQNLVAECSAAVTAADAQFRRLLAERSAEASRQAAATEAERVRSEAEVLKQAVKMLGELQAELVAAAVGPVIATANRLCEAVLPVPLEYRDGDIGFAGRGYSWKTMSGTEKTLIYAALSVALAQESPVKVVLLDEFDIDDGNWPKLVRHLCALQREGVIDQALIAHTAPPMESRNKSGSLSPIKEGNLAVVRLEGGKA